MPAARIRGRGEAPPAVSRDDAYTGMLIVSLIAMVFGCILLFLDWNQYPSQKPSNPRAYSPDPKPPAAAQPPADGQPVPPPAGTPGN
jgi:hypothetical protein